MTNEDARALMAYWEQTLTHDEQLRIGFLERINVFLVPAIQNLPWYVVPTYDHLPFEILKELASRLPTLPPITELDLIEWYKSLSDETKNLWAFRWERVEDQAYKLEYVMMKKAEGLSRKNKKAEKAARKQASFDYLKEKTRGADVEDEAHREAGRGVRGEGAGDSGGRPDDGPHSNV